MIRVIFSSLAVAAVLSTAASGHALSEDFNTWQKNFGTVKSRKGAAGPSSSPSTKHTNEQIKAQPKTSAGPTPPMPLYEIEAMSKGKDR